MCLVPTITDDVLLLMDKVLKLNPFLEVMEQYKYSIERKSKNEENAYFSLQKQMHLIIKRQQCSLLKAILPVFFDAIGESVSTTTVFSFGHSVLSTPQVLSFLFKAVRSHCFQSTQGPFGLGICGRAGSQSMNRTLV